MTRSNIQRRVGAVGRRVYANYVASSVALLALVAVVTARASLVRAAQSQVQVPAGHQRTPSLRPISASLVQFFMLCASHPAEERRYHTQCKRGSAAAGAVAPMAAAPTDFTARVMARVTTQPEMLVAQAPEVTLRDRVGVVCATLALATGLVLVSSFVAALRFPHIAFALLDGFVHLGLLALLVVHALFQATSGTTAEAGVLLLLGVAAIGIFGTFSSPVVRQFAHLPRIA